MHTFQQEPRVEVADGKEQVSFNHTASMPVMRSQQRSSWTSEDSEDDDDALEMLPMLGDSMDEPPRTLRSSMLTFDQDGEPQAAFRLNEQERREMDAMAGITRQDTIPIIMPASPHSPASPYQPSAAHQQRQLEHKSSQRLQETHSSTCCGRLMACLSVHRKFWRWIGRIRNSYFAFSLFLTSICLVVIQISVLVIIHVTDKEHHRKFPNQVDDQCHIFIHEIIGAYYLGSPIILLLVPVVWPNAHQGKLLFTIKDRRLVRKPYLQVCELVVIVEVWCIMYMISSFLLNLMTIIKCFRVFTWPELTALFTQIPTWFLLWRQLVVFCRFVAHLKLQANSWNDATHTSSMSDIMRQFMTRPTRSSTTGPQIQAFKKKLYRAVAREDVDETKQLLMQASPVYGIESVPRLYPSPMLVCFAFAKSNKNPLHIAAIRGYLPIVKLLVEHGFDVNALDKVARVNFNFGLLFKICSRFLIRTQDGLRSPLRSILCSHLVPPLHGAVANGHIHIVRYLIKKNADVDLLPRASFYNQSAVVPPIFAADDPQVLKRLVTKGANFLHVTKSSITGGQRETKTRITPLQRAALTWRTALTEYLIEIGADITLTPLHAAAAANDVKKLKALLSRGVAVDALGERVNGMQQRTPLHWAAIMGKYEAAQILLEAGANPNARDRHGRTPLHWAARNDHAQVVHLLLQHHADPQAKDNHEIPIVCFAAEEERRASSAGVELFSALAKAGASLDATKPSTKDTALHIALQRENRKTAMALIKCGANMMLTNHEGKRAVDCTTSTRLRFELKKEAGSRDVMISYTHTHFEFAKQVRNHIESTHKMTCWMDTMDPSGIGGGSVWREEIARGIHNCSLVLSIVCDGYWKSEWCLKELAFAKMIRKPVVALMVEEGPQAAMAQFDALVPAFNCLPFNDFILSKQQQGPRRVVFEINQVKFEMRMQQVLSAMKTAMQSERRIEEEIQENVMKQIEQRSMSTVEEESDGTRSTTSSGTTSAPRQESHERKSKASVLICSSIVNSAVVQRLQLDLQRFGYDCCACSAKDAFETVETWIEHARFVIMVFQDEQTTNDNGGLSGNAHMMQTARMSFLTNVLRRIKSLEPPKRLLPIIVRPNFMDHSKMYSLACSELYYVVEGVAQEHSIEYLVQQIRQFQY